MFLNQDIFESGVLAEGPIFLRSLGVDSDAFGLVLLAKFLAAALTLDTVALAFAGAFLADALALDAVALAFAGAFLAAAFALDAVALAFAGAFLAAALALDVTALAEDVALSAVSAAAAILLATAALIPTLINLEAPAEATFDTESNFASTNFLAVAAPTPGSAVNFSILEAFVCEAIVSPNTCKKAFFLELFLGLRMLSRWIDED